MNQEMIKSYRPLVGYVLTERIQIGQKGVCRYCNKKQGETKFRKEAHALPELLGNKYLFSLDECDECNEFFDKNLENNLANFLGISRTIMQTKAKSGIPKYKNGHERVEIINQDILTIEEPNSSLLTIKNDNTFTIQTKGNSYIPLNVYKCLLKMALSIIPDNELHNYTQCINWVRYNKNPDSFNKKLFKIYVSFLPGNINIPISIMLLKRTGDKKKFPNLLCFLRFDNFIFHFAVPFGGKKDKLLDVDLLDLNIPVNCDLSSNQKVNHDNMINMEYSGEFKEISKQELPPEILNRIEELGLKFPEDRQ